MENEYNIAFVQMKAPCLFKIDMVIYNVATNYESKSILRLLSI
jgi:hypothetical protein